MNPARHVSAELLSEEDRQRLEQRLEEFQQGGTTSFSLPG
jgi:hypothetical protein